MLDVRALALAAVRALGTGSALAASEWVDYAPEAFATAQESGETMLVDVTADRCPTCRAQKPILEELRAEESLEEVVFVRVNFDVHKDFLQAHNVPRQSTILVFGGNAEVGRSIAETDRERLRSFVFDKTGDALDQIRAALDAGVPLVAERARIPPRNQPASSRRLQFPPVRPGDRPPVRPERHVTNSIATMRRILIVGLVRKLERCPLRCVLGRVSDYEAVVDHAPSDP